MFMLDQELFTEIWFVLKNITISINFVRNNNDKECVICWISNYLKKATILSSIIAKRLQILDGNEM